jgi:hypothetical protein
MQGRKVPSMHHLDSGQLNAIALEFRMHTLQELVASLAQHPEWARTGRWECVVVGGPGQMTPAGNNAWGWQCSGDGLRWRRGLCRAMRGHPCVHAPAHLSASSMRLRALLAAALRSSWPSC